MKQWTIGKRITTGFVTMIVIVMALGSFAYVRLVKIQGHSDHIAKVSLPIIELVYRAQKNAKTYDHLVYEHLGSTSLEDMGQLEIKLAACTGDNDKVYAELDNLIRDAKEHSLLEETRAARGNYVKVRNEVIAMSRQVTNNAQAYLLARAQLEPASEQYLAALGSLIDFVRNDSQDASANVQSAVVSSERGLLTGLAMALVVGLGVSVMMTLGINNILRRVSQALDNGSNQVASAAGQVSSASQSLAEGSGEQAASIEQTSSSLEEMSSMTNRNAESAQKANDLAKQARSAADKGATDMQAMNAAMEAIKISSDDIAKIIKTIDEIAFQTNILALNAAVEAARAGEAGMGFAVVADEVRNLAQRSAQAAKETAAKIEGAISKSAQGVEISAQVTQTLNEIVSKARQVDELASEVAGASREQTQGIAQINSAVGQMDKVTQSNAASAEQSAAAAQELNAQAASMKQSVAELLQLVGGIQTELGGSGRSDNTATRSKSVKVHGANGNGHHSAGRGHKGGSLRLNKIPLERDSRDF